MKRKQYRSPRHKLISFFHSSRDQWRQRAKAYQEEIRGLKVRVRDVAASRDHWRARYFQSRGRADEGSASWEPPLSGPGRGGVGAAGACPRGKTGGLL